MNSNSIKHNTVTYYIKETILEMLGRNEAAKDILDTLEQKSLEEFTNPSKTIAVIVKETGIQDYINKKCKEATELLIIQEFKIKYRQNNDTDDEYNKKLKQYIKLSKSRESIKPPFTIDTSRTKFIIGYLFFIKKQYDLAITIWETKTLSIFSQYSIGLYNYYILGDIDTAIEYFNHLLTTEYYHSVAALPLSEIYFSQNKYSDGFDILEKHVYTNCKNIYSIFSDVRNSHINNGLMVVSVFNEMTAYLSNMYIYWLLKKINEHPETEFVNNTITSVDLCYYPEKNYDLNAKDIAKSLPDHRTRIEMLLKYFFNSTPRCTINTKNIHEIIQIAYMYEKGKSIPSYPTYKVLKFKLLSDYFWKHITDFLKNNDIFIDTQITKLFIHIDDYNKRTLFAHALSKTDNKLYKSCIEQLVKASVTSQDVKDARSSLANSREHSRSASAVAAPFNIRDLSPQQIDTYANEATRIHLEFENMLYDYKKIFGFKNNKIKIAHFFKTTKTTHNIQKFKYFISSLEKIVNDLNRNIIAPLHQYNIQRSYVWLRQLDPFDVEIKKAEDFKISEEYFFKIYKKYKYVSKSKSNSSSE